MNDKAVNSNTLTLKKNKPAITEGSQRGSVKHSGPSPEPTQPPPAPKPAKKEKPFRLQYRGKEGTPMAATHKEWKHLDAFVKLEQALNAGRTKKNGNNLTKMFEYRVIDKDNKEYTV